MSRWLLGLLLLAACRSPEDRSAKLEATANEWRTEAERLRGEYLGVTALLASERAAHAAEDSAVRAKMTALRARPVPDTCLTFTAPRDTVIAQLAASTIRWNATFAQQAEAAGKAAAAITLYSKADSTRAKAVDVLRRGPSLGFRLTHPTLKPAVFAGMCLGGTPCAGAGVAVTF